MRVLGIRIEIDHSQARTALRETEQGLAGVEKTAERAAGSTKGVQSSLDRIGKIGMQMAGAGAGLTYGVTQPLMDVGAAALDAGLDFEKAMNAIRGVLTPTAAEMELVRSKSLEMGAKTVFSATEAATAILELGKAGFTTSESLTSVDEVLQLAAASGLQMGRAAEMSARTIQAFGLTTNDLSHVNDVLAKAVNTSSLEITDLETAFKYVGPIATGFGVTIEQTTAALATMRDAGIAAETSGRAMREGLSRLVNPTKNVTEVLKELGVETVMSGDNLMNLGDLVGLFESKNITAAQALKLFGDAAGPGMYALIKQGKPAFDALTASLETSNGAAKAMADAMMTGLPGAIEQTRGSLETMRIKVLQALEPALIRILGVVANLADRFVAMPEWLQVVIASLGALAAAVGPVLMVIGSMAAGVSALMPVLTGLAALFTIPAGLVIAGIIAVVAVWKNWDTIGPIVQRVYMAVKEWLVDKFAAVVNWIGEKVGLVTGFFKTMYDKTVGHSYVPDMMLRIAVLFQQLQAIMVAPAEQATLAVSRSFERMGQAVVPSVQGLFGNIEREGTGFGGRMRGIFNSVAGDLNAIFQRAFEGGGGVMGAVKSLATNATSALLNMIPVVGPFLSQFSGAIVAGLSKIGGKIKDFFKGLFGGPSGEELAGRELVADFEKELDGLLTDTQRLATGNEGWKNTVVAIRDRYLELGLTEAEALRDTERLWASSREGAEAAMRVIEEIRRKFEGGITIPVRMDLPEAVGTLDPQFGRVVDLPTFHDGGVVARRPVVTAGLSDDEVLVLAQRGEGVINRGGMDRLGASGLAAINSGMTARQEDGGDTTINLYVSGYLDSPESARHLGRVVQRQFDHALQRRRRVSLRA